MEHRLYVSILTRPWGRVQPKTCSMCWAISRTFQSSPARGGGCNVVLRRDGRFVVYVSILTRPWGRVQRAAHIRKQRIYRVSILTRPWGRVQQCTRHHGIMLPCGFNPHPPVGAGATCAVPIRDAPRLCFNPHPPVGAGATVHVVCLDAHNGGFNPHPPVGAGATYACDWR